MLRSPRPLLAIHRLTTLTALTALGCAGASGPETPQAPRPLEGIPPPIVMTDRDTGLGALFSASIVLDTATMSAHLEPRRSAAAGTPDILEVVDVTQFFASAPCTDCLEIVGVGTSAAGNPTLDISLRHPFPSPAPTVAMNQDFSVFNVEGMVYFDETGGTVTDYASMLEKVLTSTRLVNADGYSDYLDGAYDIDYFATEATLHPYRLFFDDYSNGTFDPTSPQGFPDYADVRGHLAMGQGKGPDVQRFEFAISDPGETIRFDLIVQASFGNAASNRPEKSAPEYRVPQYNKKAASEVHGGILQITPAKPEGQGLIAGDSTSGALLHLSILDITDVSTGVIVGPDRDQIRAASDVDEIRVEVAGITTGVVTIGDPGTVFRGGVGDDPNNPLTYNIGISNEQSADEGLYFGLVKVRDSYAPGLNIVFPEDGQRFLSPGFTTPFPVAEFSTFALVDVPVNPATPRTLAATPPDAAAGLGTSLAVGDFNGDGVWDLAAGAYEATVSAVVKAGKVNVFYGFSTGDFSPGIALSEIAPATNARLGFSLAATDVTGDGRDDLLAGGVFTAAAGRVQLFRSTGLGFASPAAVQDAGLSANARYGYSIAAANLDDDGFMDVLIGAPQADGGFGLEGKLYRYLGSASGLTNRDILTPPDGVTNGFFGISIVGLNNADGLTTAVATGMPGHAAMSGRVYVYGVSSSSGALTTPTAIDSGGLPAATNFGFVLAAGDLDNDGTDDLVVGAPGSASELTGRAQVLYRTGAISFTTGPVLGITDAASASFGSAITIGDFDGNGRNDVAVGGPQITVGGGANAGRVALFPEGLPTTDQPLEMQHPTPAAGLLFGRVLATIPRPSSADVLVVGVPGDDPSAVTDAGTVMMY